MYNVTNATMWYYTLVQFVIHYVSTQHQLVISKVNHHSGAWLVGVVVKLAASLVSVLCHPKSQDSFLNELAQGMCPDRKTDNKVKNSEQSQTKSSCLLDSLALNSTVSSY